ncbi:branched-chain amino acid aminotransferase [bacterium]|nr:branched-chain amino acid aminotransferase [bacterium]
MTFIPYDDRDGWIWMDGAFTPWRDARIHVLTHGLHYGACVFEGERAYEGVVFKGEEHSLRLHRSAELVGYKIPFAAEEIDRAKLELMDKNGLSDCYVRAFAWRGSEMMGVSAQKASIRTAIAVWPWGDYFADKMKGIRVTMSQWKRPSPETIPSAAKAAGLYMICTMSKHKAEAEGFADALMLDYRGYVAELTGANVFLIQDGAIHTPIADCFLDGITRRTVIDLARRRGIEVVERRILPSELSDFSECFITGTAAEVTPVAEMAGVTYRPGAITEQLMTDYAALVRGRLAAPKATGARVA